MSTTTTDAPEAADTKATAKGKAAEPTGATSMTQAIRLIEAPIERHYLPIVGTSALITHKWSEKAKKAMLDKQMKKAAAPKEAKDPEKDYRDSLYILPDGTGYGFPSVGFKAAMVRAGTYLDFKMTFLRGAFHIPGEFVTIIGEPRPREDMVRIAGGTADIRYRGEFPEWSALLPLDINTSVISLEQVANLAYNAGFSVGVGEWRPEKNGQFGTWRLAMPDEAEAMQALAADAQA